MRQQNSYWRQPRVGFDGARDHAADRVAFGTSILDVDAGRFFPTSDGDGKRSVACRGWIISRHVEIETTRAELAKWTAAAGGDRVLPWQQTEDSIHAPVIAFRPGSQTRHI